MKRRGIEAVLRSYHALGNIYHQDKETALLNHLDNIWLFHWRLQVYILCNACSYLSRMYLWHKAQGSRRVTGTRDQLDKECRTSNPLCPQNTPPGMGSIHFGHGLMQYRQHKCFDLIFLYPDLFWLFDKHIQQDKRSYWQKTARRTPV